MEQLLELLGIQRIQYNANDDPMKVTQRLLYEHIKSRHGEDYQNGRLILNSEHDDFEPIEWTIPEEWVKDKELAEKVKSKKLIRNKRQSKINQDRDLNGRKKSKIDLKSESNLQHYGSEKETDCVKKEEIKTYSNGNTVDNLSNVNSTVKCEDTKSFREQIEEIKEETLAVTDEHAVSEVQNGTEINLFGPNTQL